MMTETIGARLVALPIALALLLALASGVTATHDGQDVALCTAPELGEPSFACGIVVITLDPDGPERIEPVIAACEPPAHSVTGGTERDAVYGRLGYHVEVPVGNEIALRDCYAEQRGVWSATLAGVGELTPDTATRAGPSLSAVAMTVGALLVGAGRSTYQ